MPSGTETVPACVAGSPGLPQGSVEFCHGTYHRRGIPQGLFQPKKWVTRSCDCKGAKRD